jgi:PAS domain S-box-containing protein
MNSTGPLSHDDLSLLTCFGARYLTIPVWIQLTFRTATTLAGGAIVGSRFVTRNEARIIARTSGWMAMILLLGGCQALSAGEVSIQSAHPLQRILHVVLSENYPPYSFRSADARLQGILVDQWRAWEEKTGIKVDLQGMDWGSAVDRMRAGDFDVIESIVKNEERRAFMDFTPPYATIEVPIYYRSDISGITNLASLRGFPVGVVAGDQHIAKLIAAGVTTLIPFSGFEAIVAAAKQRRISVFVGDAVPSVYFLNKAGLAGEFRHSAPIFREELQRGVRKGDPALLREVMQGFAGIDPAELARIEEKWFGRTINGYARYLAYAGAGAGAALLLAAGLVAWNRTLHVRIRQRTAALAESEERFRQIAENIHEVFWLASADWSETLYISAAYETVWGRPRDGVYREPRSFIDAIHPDERAHAVEMMDGRREYGFDIEYRIVRPDGGIRWIRDRGFPIRNAEGRVYRTAGIAEDVTARKMAAEVMTGAEARSRLTIDTIPTMAWSMGCNGTVDFINRRWLDYTGLSFAEYLADPTMVIHPDDRTEALAKWRTNVAVSGPFEGEMRLRRADGQYRWFLVRTEPARDRTGNVIAWFGVSIDIEDRKEAEAAVCHREQQLRALVQRLHNAREEEAKRIARELHDDLGQQLTVFRLQLDKVVLNLADLHPGQRTELAGMREVVDNMIHVVQTIASELRLGQLDVLGLTATIEWQLKEFSRRASMDCVITRLDEVANLSDAQNTAVFRILQEALTNIARHAGAARVEVSLQAGPHDVTLRVSDDGRGITAAEISDRKSIGLLGMRERAEIVGGTVTVGLTANDCGTTVMVTIPLDRSRSTPA